MSCLQVSIDVMLHRRSPILLLRNPLLTWTLFTLIYSKPALTEGVEIDQYIWAILNTLNGSNTEEVTIDSDANWKAIPPLNAPEIKVCFSPSRIIK